MAPEVCNICTASMPTAKIKKHETNDKHTFWRIKPLVKNRRSPLSPKTRAVPLAVLVLAPEDQGTQPRTKAHASRFGELQTYRNSALSDARTHTTFSQPQQTGRTNHLSTQHNRPRAQDPTRGSSQRQGDNADTERTGSPCVASETTRFDLRQLIQLHHTHIPPYKEKQDHDWEESKS